MKKCSFLQTETNYLGFVIDENGMKPDQKEVEAIRACLPQHVLKKVDLLFGMFFTTAGLSQTPHRLQSL